MQYGPAAMPDLEARISLRLPVTLKTELEELSAETRRSLNSTIVVILERAIELVNAGAPIGEDL